MAERGSMRAPLALPPLLLLLLLLCGPLAPPAAQARVVSFRLMNLTAGAGLDFFEGLMGNVSAGSWACGSGTTARQTNCTSPCTTFTGGQQGDFRRCSPTIAPRCGPNNWCSMELDLEVTTDLPGSSSSDRVLRMHTVAPPVVHIEKVFGPVYVAATRAIPENRARWRYRVSAATQVWSAPVLFSATQGGNERGVTYNLVFQCRQRTPTPGLAVVFDSPVRANCSDGTIRATATVKGCPSFASYNPEGELTLDSGDLASGRLNAIHVGLFPWNASGTTSYQGLATLTGEADGVLGDIYREFAIEEPVYSYITPIGPGRIEVVMRRRLVTFEVLYPYTYRRWLRPPLSDPRGFKLGWRYQATAEDGTVTWVPPPPAPDSPTPTWFLSPRPTYYMDLDNDGFGVTQRTDPATTFGTCDCNDSNVNKTRSC